MSFLLNKEFFDRLEVNSTPNTELSPFADWMHGTHGTRDKSTQTDPVVETLLGRLVLAHCPNPEFVENYVDHTNTSKELVRLLKRDTPPQQAIRSGPSRSNA